MDNDRLPIAQQVQSLLNSSSREEYVINLEPVQLDLCLATFLVEAVSSIGTSDQWQWEQRLGIRNHLNQSTEPDIESLRKMLTNTPLHSAFVEKDIISSSLVKVIKLYRNIGAKTNVRARLHLMSWAVSDIPRSKLKTQAAMLCNLSKAHQYVRSNANTNENESSYLKWVSTDVLKLWLGQDTMRNVFLFHTFPPQKRFPSFEDIEIEKILKEKFLATLSLYGDAGLDLLQHTSPLFLLTYLTSSSLSTEYELKIQRGPLIPLSEGELARNLIYAHEIQEEKRTRNSDSSADSHTLPFFYSREADCEGENLLCAPFDTTDLRMEIRRSKRRFKRRREMFEKKISEIVQEPNGTITRGNWGRRFIGVILILAVIVLIVVVYRSNPVDRKHSLERVFDAFEAGTILTAIVTIILKVISPDSSVLRNSLLGKKLLIEFDQITNYCKVRSRRELCLLLAAKERTFRWLSQENLSFINGSLTGEIRKDDGIRLFELARMGFTIEGRYIFNPYTEKYFEITRDSTFDSRLNSINPNRIPTFPSPGEMLKRRLPCSNVIR